MFNTQQLAKEIFKYLSDKYPEMPYSTALEIAEYLTLKTVNITCDEKFKAIHERDKIWQAEMKRQFKAKRS
jgi:hypothetical protein